MNFTIPIAMIKTITLKKKTKNHHIFSCILCILSSTKIKYIKRTQTFILRNVKMHYLLNKVWREKIIKIFASKLQSE